MARRLAAMHRLQLRRWWRGGGVCVDGTGLQSPPTKAESQAPFLMPDSVGWMLMSLFRAGAKAAASRQRGCGRKWVTKTSPPQHKFLILASFPWASN